MEKNLYEKPFFAICMRKVHFSAQILKFTLFHTWKSINVEIGTIYASRNFANQKILN